MDVLVQGSELAAALDEDRIQLAIVDENCARGFQWTPLTDAPLVAVTPPDFPWTGETISLARLLQEPFLFSRTIEENISICRRTRRGWR